MCTLADNNSCANRCKSQVSSACQRMYVVGQLHQAAMIESSFPQDACICDECLSVQEGLCSAQSIYEPQLSARHA